MNNIKKMIFDYINANDINEDELQKLFFAIAKDTVKTKQINPLTQLFYKHTKDFKDILDDILIAQFDMERIRIYREQETWGNAYRKTAAYTDLIHPEVKIPFIRNK